MKTQRWQRREREAARQVGLLRAAAPAGGQEAPRGRSRAAAEVPEASELAARQCV